MHAVGLKWAHLEIKKKRPMKRGEDGGVEWNDGADGCSTLTHTMSQEAHRLCFRGCSERVLKDNPFYKPTALTPLLILCLKCKKIWIFSAQHAGVLFLNPAIHGVDTGDWRPMENTKANPKNRYSSGEKSVKPDIQNKIRHETCPRKLGSRQCFCPTYLKQSVWAF